MGKVLRRKDPKRAKLFIHLLEVLLREDQPRQIAVYSKNIEDNIMKEVSNLMRYENGGKNSPWLSHYIYQELQYMVELGWLIPYRSGCKFVEINPKKREALKELLAVLKKLPEIL